MKPQTQISPVLAELLPCVVVETNCRGEIIFVNDRWTSVSGYSLEETVGQPWTSFVNEISFLELVNQMTDFWGSKETTIKFSTIIEHKKGTQRDLEVKLSKLYTSRGRLRGLVATFLDISVYKQTNNILGEKRRALSAVLKSIENVVIEFDYEGRVRNLW